MLHAMDESLEALLRAKVPLAQDEVDVVFDAPDREWATTINRPTVNLYLWDIRRNLAESDGGVEQDRDEAGRLVRRPPWPVLDCRYLVTAWTTDVRDEHSLLGAVLLTLLRTPKIPEEHLGEHLRVGGPRLSIAYPDGEQTADVWSALGGQLKPGLDLIVTVTVAATPIWPTGRLVEHVDLQAGTKGKGDTSQDQETVTWTDSELRPPPR